MCRGIQLFLKKELENKNTPQNTLHMITFVSCHHLLPGSGSPVAKFSWPRDFSVINLLHGSEDLRDGGGLRQGRLVLVEVVAGHTPPFSSPARYRTAPPTGCRNQSKHESISPGGFRGDRGRRVIRKSVEARRRHTHCDDPVLRVRRRDPRHRIPSAAAFGIPLPRTPPDGADPGAGGYCFPALPPTIGRPA